MNAKLEDRLNSLKSEYETGQKMLAELDARRRQISDTILRIEGAMQLVKELLDEEKAQHANGASAAPPVESPSPVALS